MKRTTSNEDRCIATTGSDHVARSKSPDVCKVPGQGPQPFDNWVNSSELKKGATQCTFIAGEKVWTEHGELGPLSEPGHGGTAKGVASVDYRGATRATSFSIDVFFEGGAVVRADDTTTQNKANTNGIVMPAAGTYRQTAGTAAGWDLPGLLKILCKKDKALVDYTRNNIDLYKVDRVYFEDPYFDGTTWGTKLFEAGGTSGGGDIVVLSTTSNQSAATTLYHEVWHDQQSPTMGWPHPSEDEAYYQTELWTIDRGLPGQGGGTLRTTNAAGATVPVSMKDFAAYVDVRLSRSDDRTARLEGRRVRQEQERNQVATPNDGQEQVEGFEEGRHDGRASTDRRKDAHPRPPW